MARLRDKWTQSPLPDTLAWRRWGDQGQQVCWLERQQGKASTSTQELQPRHSCTAPCCQPGEGEAARTFTQSALLGSSPAPQVRHRARPRGWADAGMGGMIQCSCPGCIEVAWNGGRPETQPGYAGPGCVAGAHGPLQTPGQTVP